MCVTDRLDMTLAVKVALNPNTTNNQNNKVKDSSKLKASTSDKSKIRSNDLEFTDRLETFEIKKKKKMLVIGIFYFSNNILKGFLP